MQPVIAGPRIGLNAQAIYDLIELSPTLDRDCGCELIDINLNVMEDISSDLLDGSVARNSYDTLHGHASLELSRELAWGSSIVRPYVVLSDGVTTARFNMGAYFTSVSQRDVFAPRQVECFDILDALNDPVGASFALSRGTSYITAVTDIFAERGYTKFIVDTTAADKTLPHNRSWVFDENLTWLNIVNDLHASIGYQGVWSDWDGNLRCTPYRSPRDRQWEWAHSAVSEFRTLIGPERSVEHDTYNAFNHWVFYRTNMGTDVAPVPGNGIYEYKNQIYGDTCIDARNGREITAVIGIDAADQQALVAAAQSRIDADITVSTSMTLKTTFVPNWHFDKVLVDDPDLGLTGEALVTSWTLPLKEKWMPQTWTPLSAWRAPETA